MPNNEYWIDRMSKVESMANKKGMDYTNHVNKQFQIAQKNIEQKIEYWYAKIADNNEISMSAAKELLRRDELEDFHMTVEEYIKKGEMLDIDNRWEKQLKNASAKVHIQRLEALKLQMQQECEVLFGGMVDGLDDTLTDIYGSTYYHTAYEYMRGCGVGWAFNRLDNRRIKKALETCWTNDNETFSSRVWKNKNKLINDLNTVLTQSIIRGESPQKAISLLSQKMRTSRYNAGRLIMTESSAIYSASQKDCYKELDVEKYEFVATLDSSTSEICRDMDGKVFDMSDYKVGLTAPPLHCFCRSVTVPYFPDEDGQRIARGEDGKTYYVPANMTYNEWYKKYVKTQTNNDNKLDISNLSKEETISKISEFENKIKKMKDDAMYSETEEKWNEWQEKIRKLENSSEYKSLKEHLESFKGEISHSKSYNQIEEMVKKNNVEKIQVKNLNKPLTNDEIIDRISGGDLTDGSCSSLAFAYIGNTCGYDVLDFRGGNSQYCFSLNTNIKKMLDLDGVKGEIIKVKKEAFDTAKIIKELPKNKEYYISVGKHASIIKNTDKGVMYLELQSKCENGWKFFETSNRTTSETLNWRFGARKTVDKSYGKVWEKDVVLMEVDSFNGNEEFKDLLGYINTNIDKQKKGVKGGIK